MGLGLSIGLKLKQGYRAPSGAFAGISVYGAYDSRESAVSDGIPASGYYVLTIDNIYGMPVNTLMRNTPIDGYADVEAGQAAVGDNTVFQLLSGNPQGWPAGICIIANPEEAYANDTAAGVGGVAIGSLYAIDEVNLGKRIKQRSA
jgi:hypothetical protein